MELKLGKIVTNLLLINLYLKYSLLFILLQRQSLNLEITKFRLYIYLKNIVNTIPSTAPSPMSFIKFAFL